MKRIHLYNQWKEFKNKPYFDIDLLSFKFNGYLGGCGKGCLDLDIIILGFNLEIELIK